MNKIGIITFHRSYNYGSALQAYALQKYINTHNLGRAEVIDYILKSNFEQYKLFHFSCYLKNPRWLISDLVYLKRNSRRKRNFEKFVEQYIPLTIKQYFSSEDMKELNKQYDIFICGSDQIWNVECTNGVEPAYFLEFASNEKRKMAYAPSIAHLNFSEDVLSKMSAAIEGFKAISIREESNVEMLSQLTNQKVEIVLDPTLLLDSKDYEELFSRVHKERYVFVYMLEYNKELVMYAVELAKRANLKIYYISKKNEQEYHDALNLYGISPAEFLEYLHDAEYVVTNSFHATVFSALFEKKFCTFKTLKSYSRMVDLLTKLGIEDRLYDAKFDISCEINYKVVNKKLQTLKQSSMSYLERNCLEE